MPSPGVLSLLKLAKKVLFYSFTQVAKSGNNKAQEPKLNNLTQSKALNRKASHLEFWIDIFLLKEES